MFTASIDTGNITHGEKYVGQDANTLHIAGATSREDRVEGYIAKRTEAFLYPEYALIEGYIRTEFMLQDLLLLTSASLDLTPGILFISTLNASTQVVADVWIIYLTDHAEKKNLYNLTFRCFSALAGFFFLLGSILYLPQYNTSPFTVKKIRLRTITISCYTTTFIKWNKTIYK
ncbi:hypothetical protein I4U23_015352 [Adineta vaga]|nr:hypothetical protein I4U23_015352 [Adineta vaga]